MGQIDLFDWRPDEKIRLIDHHTLYDVPYMLERLSREVRSGRYGNVTDAVIGIRCIKDGHRDVEGFLYGQGSTDTAIAVLDRVKDRIINVTS